MRRFTLFSAALLVLIIAGSVPWKARGLSKTACVCVPARAALMLRSMTTLSVVKTTMSVVKTTQPPANP